MTQVFYENIGIFTIYIFTLSIFHCLFDCTVSYLSTVNTKNNSFLTHFITTYYGFYQLESEMSKVNRLKESY